MVWQNLGINNSDNSFFAGDLSHWLTVNAKAKTSKAGNQLPWNSIFLFAIWNIWLKRNAVVFHNKPFPLNLHAEITQRATEFFYCALNRKAANRGTPKLIRSEKHDHLAYCGRLQAAG